MHPASESISIHYVPVGIMQLLMTGHKNRVKICKVYTKNSKIYEFKHPGKCHGLFELRANFFKLSRPVNVSFRG